jgi:hypothetical protein
MKIICLIISFSSIPFIAFSQWSESGNDLTTTYNSIILNRAKKSTGTLWFGPTNSGPATIGHYYIKAYDYWGPYLHFQGTGDNGNERMKVTVDGSLGIGTLENKGLLDIYGNANSRLLVGVDKSHAHHIASYRDLVFNSVNGFYWRNNKTAGSVGDFDELMHLSKYGSLAIGNRSPKAKLHVTSSRIQLNNTSAHYATFLVEATSDSRRVTEGAALGFVVPANSDGGNPWQQGRIIVTPENTHNRNAKGKMYLQTRGWNASEWTWNNNLVLNSDGNVGIGETNPSKKLVVNGVIGATEVKVSTTPNSDYVFEPDYDLKPLQEVDQFIQQNKHLPDIPSAEEFKENGVGLGEMDDMLLRKVEELTLYVIELRKENDQLNNIVQNQNERIKNLENEN